MRVVVLSVVLLVLGTIGVVINRRAAPRGPAIAENAEVAIISTGGRVDIDAHVPRQGLTIVEFTADF